MSAAFTPVVGYHAILKGWNTYDVEEIARVTPKLVFTKRATWGSHQRKHDALTAQFADREAAEQLAQSLNGALGEYRNRCTKARAEYDARESAAKEAFDKVAADLIARARDAQ